MKNAYLTLNCHEKQFSWGFKPTLIELHISGGRKSADSRAPSDEEYDTGDNWSTASVLSEDQTDSIPEDGRAQHLIDFIFKFYRPIDSLYPLSNYWKRLPNEIT